MDLSKIIRNIPDFPEAGIQFKDIESITENPAAFRFIIDEFARAISGQHIDKILVLDARGFLFGAALGYKESLPIVMARKAGKLGGDSVSKKYSLEYGEASIELQRTAVSKGEQVLIVDDLLATGGTAAAAADLVKQVGAKVCQYAFVIELDELGGREKLGLESTITSLVNY